MTDLLPPAPCYEDRAPRPTAGRPRIRVVEIIATGTNGGAQEHVAALLWGLDKDRFDVRVIVFSEGSSLGRWRETGVPVEVVSSGDELEVVAQLADRLAGWQTQVLHGLHSSRQRSAEDCAVLDALDPAVDRLVAVSRAMEAKLEAERPRRPPVELIYNGVDLSRYDRTEACCRLPEEYGFGETDPVVGRVARLEPEKGHTTLLEAWPLVLEAVPDARLLLVGEGSRCEALRAQAESLGLMGEPCEGDACVGTLYARPGARVLFTGRRDDVPSITGALDVAVLPSHHEAQGLVILEAMALARPVVATRVGGISEMVEHEVTGLLVPPRDPAALAAAIVRLLQDRAAAEAFARAGHDLVHERFCIERMVADISAIYEEGAGVWAERGRSGSLASLRN